LAEVKFVAQTQIRGVWFQRTACEDIQLSHSCNLDTGTW